MARQYPGTPQSQSAASLEQVDQRPTLPVEIPDTPREHVDATIDTLATTWQGGRVEQQPTQPIEKEARQVEELATMPELKATVKEARQVEELATMPELKAAVKEPRLDLQSTLQVSSLPAQSTRPSSQTGRWKLLRWGMLLPLCLILIFSAVIGHDALLAWFGAITNPGQSHTTATPAVVTNSHRSPTTASVIMTTSQTFMKAFMRKDWATLWSMLAPNAQALYDGEADFIHFEQAKFGKLTLSHYQLGQAEMVQPWLDSDSTQVYPLAGVVNVSMDASGSPASLSSLSIADLSNGLFHTTTLAMIPHNGQWQIVLAGPADLDAPILVPASPPATRLLVPIFMYHHVSNIPTTNALDYSLTVTTTDFNAQLDWLQQQGYTSIDMTELFDSLYYGKALPSHPMILTFDDGYEDAYTDTLPSLLKHHYRGVFYIITGMIGGRYMTWSQVRILQAEGMQIASHTVHHVNIGEPPYGTSTQGELVQSKDTLQKLLSLPIQFFCYPTGEPFHHDTVAEQQIVLQDLYSDGYIGATLDPFSFETAIQNAQMPYQLQRIRVSGGEQLSAFTGTLTSVLTYGTQQLNG